MALRQAGGPAGRPRWGAACTARWEVVGAGRSYAPTRIARARRARWLCRAEGADADDRDEDDLDFEDLLELVGHEGLMELGELDEGALEARLDELLGQARRARAARQDPEGMPGQGAGGREAHSAEMFVMCNNPSLAF